MPRMIVLDTETTGLDPKKGHRIIEIGCVEVIDRKITGNHYHVYINPQRIVDEAAFAIHGLDNNFLADKPLFSEVADDFLDFVRGAELVIHNAPFDTGFINHEFQLLAGSFDNIESYCKITDTLLYARKKHIGQKNSLDALCRRYEVDNSGRTYHGALLDSELLADVYLRMTGGQTDLVLGSGEEKGHQQSHIASLNGIGKQVTLKVVKASANEIIAHQEKLKTIAKESGKPAIWEEIL